MELYNLVSLAGVLALLGFALLLNPSPRRTNLRVVGWGLAVQLVLALFIFRVPAGRRFFLLINDAVVALLEPAAAGVRFVFGPLAKGPGEEGSLGFILAFQGLPTIIFFSALIAVLYHYRVMPLLLKVFARFFTKTMRISGAESLCAASNIFVGVESAFTVRPHLAAMTRSELCTVLTAGMATVASNVLAVYVLLLRETFPTIAGHLVSASFLSAPAALVMSKMLLPETGRPRTLGLSVAPHYEKHSNVFEAVIAGAQGGVKVIVGVVALLIAVLGLVALLDLLLKTLGNGIGPAIGLSGDWSLRAVLGVLFYPFTLAVGIPPADAGTLAGIIGERLVVTELTAYEHLAAEMARGGLKHSRSGVIAAYALCGFAHVPSVAIFVGGISALAPSQTRSLSSVAFRALVAATLACLLTAAVAGVFFSEGSILLGE